MKPQAYYLLVELSEQLRGASYERHMVAENYALNALVRNKTGKVTASLKDLEFVQLRLDRLPRLSRPAAMFLVLSIGEKLKKYNLLWHYPPAKKTNEKNILKELIDMRVLFRTESVGIYIVNPAWIWRGTMFTCVESTKTLLRKEGRPTVEMIRDLKPNQDYMLKSDQDHFHLLNNEDFHTNMLEEPETGYNKLKV